MYYVMSDIHGCFEQFKTALKEWSPENETLVLLGDYVDRGPNSKQVVQKIMRLKQTYGDKVVALQGNHEEMLTSWLLETDPCDLAFYYTETHVETLQSFFDADTDSGKRKYKKSTREQRAKHMLYKYRSELQFLKQLPHYHETEHLIFVHAGLNLRISNWKEDTTAMAWARNEFIYSKEITPKKVFFGHTPTAFLHPTHRTTSDEPRNHDVWINEQNDRVCIDGACSMGGQLNAVKVNTVGDIIETVCVPTT